MLDSFTCFKHVVSVSVLGREANYEGKVFKSGAVLLAKHRCGPIEKSPPKAVIAGYTPNKVLDRAKRGSESRIAKTTTN